LILEAPYIKLLVIKLILLSLRIDEVMPKTLDLTFILPIFIAKTLFP